MIRFLFFALGAFALTACDDLQISHSAKWSLEHMSYASAGFGGWEYGDLQRGLRRRQQQWDYHNRYHSGGQPGWEGRPCAPEATLDPCRPHRDGRRLAVMLPGQMNAPSLGEADREVYLRMGRAHGIGPRSSVVLLEALNRAAVGDFGGLEGLGLTASNLASAHREQGHLDQEALAELSDALGLSSSKTDALIQAVMGKKVYSPN